MYPWPIGDFDYAMDEALDTAMNYLEHTGQAERFIVVQRVAATAIVAAWKMGGTGFGWLISRSRLWNGKRSRFRSAAK